MAVIKTLEAQSNRPEGFGSDSEAVTDAGKWNAGGEATSVEAPPEMSVQEGRREQDEPQERSTHSDEQEEEEEQAPAAAYFVLNGRFLVAFSPKNGWNFGVVLG